MFNFKFSFSIVALVLSLSAGANTGFTAQDLSGLYLPAFPGSGDQNMSQMGTVNSISEIYALMNLLQMNGAGSKGLASNPLMMNFADPMLMQNTNPFGGSMGIDPTWLQLTGAVK